MDGLRWSDGFEAWKRLRRWHERGTVDGDPALDALSDIGALRRLLDQAELSAVRAARDRAKSWAEIATRLGVTRQSAWERWRDLDDSPPPARPSSRLSAEEVAAGLRDAAEGAAAELMAAALDGPESLVVVPDVVGLEWDTARRVLASARLVAVSADPDGPPLPALATGGEIVVEQKPGAGEQAELGSSVRLWLGRGPGDAGVREPLHPRPTPRATGGAIDETTGKAVP
jgi:PASTA domain